LKTRGRELLVSAEEIDGIQVHKGRATRSEE
jgi:hypothetical protein